MAVSEKSLDPPSFANDSCRVHKRSAMHLIDDLACFGGGMADGAGLIRPTVDGLVDWGE